MIVSPCKDCGDRNEKCHVICEKYAQFVKEHGEEKEKIQKAIMVANYKSHGILACREDQLKKYGRSYY